jgi:predicted ribosome quality control (RQC) complex YloA/Tae2 family protein
MRREAQSRGDQGTDHRRVTMNDADYMKRKDEINRQLQVSQEKLDNIVVQYVEVISRVLSEWAKETVEDAVMDKAEITKSLPEKELREMKAQMNALMDELPAWVSEEFDKDEKWPHRMDIPKDLHRDRMEIQLAIERSLAAWAPCFANTALSRSEDGYGISIWMAQPSIATICREAKRRRS